MWTIFSDLFLIECGRNNGVQLIKYIMASILLLDHSLGKKQALMLLECSSSPMEMPCGEEIRHSANREELRPLANSHISKLSWKQAQQPQSSFHITAPLESGTEPLSRTVLYPTETVR